MWYYRSRVGLMRIIPYKGKYALEIDDEVCGYYQTPDAAADDVASFSTNCYEWDSLASRIKNYPVDLSEWDQVK